jgi:hypothetical protein
MIDKDMMVLQNYTKVKKEEWDPFGETYPTSVDAKDAKNIKAEEVSDVDEEEDPVPITFLKIKAEPEVSCISLCPLFGRYHKYAEMPVVFLIPLSLSVNMKHLHCSVDWILKIFF